MLRSLFNALLNYGKEIYNRLSSKILYPIVLNINRYDNTRDETFPLPKRKPYKEKEGSFLMKRLGKISLALLAVIVIVACSNKKGSNGEEDSPSQSFPPEDLPEKFLAGEFEAIYHQTSKAFQESVSLKEFKKLGKDFTKGVNNFESVSTMPVQAFTEYQWISDAGDKGIRSYFAEDYTIEGLQVLPIHSYESDEVYTKNTYQMPMAGEWFTFWGGTNELVNYHYAVESQRYAYDLVIVENNSTFEGDPTKKMKATMLLEKTSLPLMME